MMEQVFESREDYLVFATYGGNPNCTWCNERKAKYTHSKYTKNVICQECLDEKFGKIEQEAEEEIDDRDYLKLVYLKDSIEHEELIFLPEFNWRNHNYLDFMGRAEKVISNRIKDIKHEKYDWTFNCVTIPTHEEYNSKDYVHHFLFSHLIKKVGRFNQSFEVLINCLKAKSPYKQVHALYDMNIHKNERSFWLLPDGSTIGVGFGEHRSLVEYVLGLKEVEIEEKWVKCSAYTIYMHNNMTAEQYNKIKELKILNTYVEDTMLMTKYKG